MDQLEARISQLIIDVLNLEDITAADIDPDEALFGEGLNLDSIDALEIGIELQKVFGLKINSQDKELATHFRSVRNLARFITAQQEKVA